MKKIRLMCSTTECTRGIVFFIPEVRVMIFLKDFLYRIRQKRLKRIYGKNVGPKYIKDDRWIAPIVEPGTNEIYIEEGGIHWVFSEYFWHGLVYHFYINGHRDHEHTFEAVMNSAFEFADVFDIREEDKHEYSKQELDYLQVIIEKTRLERNRWNK